MRTPKREGPRGPLTRRPSRCLPCCVARMSLQAALIFCLGEHPGTTRFSVSTDLVLLLCIGVVSAGQRLAQELRPCEAALSIN